MIEHYQNQLILQHINPRQGVKVDDSGEERFDSDSNYYVGSDANMHKVKIVMK